MARATPAFERHYPLAHIYAHPRLQIRGGTNYATVQKYKRAMRKGDEFPAIRLAEIGGKLYIIDGHHRIEAAIACGQPSILGTQKRMSLDNAQREALAANMKHARPLTQKEKKHAFSAYIEHGLHLDRFGSVKSVRQIASECECYSFQSVSRKLRELSIDAPREDVESFSTSGPGDDDDICSTELESRDLSMLEDFRNNLNALGDAYGLLSDTGRRIAHREISSLVDAMASSQGLLEV